jgi:DNA-directed RNA polymerase specialized sigma24 family protein
MNQDDMRLSRIETLWSVVRQANEGGAENARRAQQTLLERYGGAIRRYLLGSLRNEDAADEVFQDFSLKLVTGAFQKAHASHGRFRSFLKTTLFHLIIDYQRRGKRNAARALLDETPDRPFCEDRLAEEDRAWTRSWREELLAKGWSALAKTEQATGTPYYTVLRFRSEHPELRSQEIADQLNARIASQEIADAAQGKLAKKLGSSSVRVLIHRAREMLAEHVLDLVLDSIDSASLEECEEELIDLNLLEYCRSALQRRRGEPSDAPPA